MKNEKNDLKTTVTESYKTSTGKKITFTKTVNTDKSSKLGIIGILFTIFAIVVFCRFMFNPTGAEFTFTGFLQTLANVPTNSDFLNLVIENITISGNWGVFDFLKYFLNILLTPIKLLSWLSITIINALEYIFYILQYVLGF